MRQGTVKWYDGKKCFGFITPVDGGEDVFVHSSVIKAADLRFLNEGDEVAFDTEDRNGKLSVSKLELIKRNEESAKKFAERRGPRREGGFGGDRRGGGDRRREGGDRREGGERKSFAFWKK